MKGEVFEIDNWSTVLRYKNEYEAPERGELCLAGDVFNRPTHPGEVSHVITSRIVAVDGFIVKTASGSTYILKSPDHEWLDWLKENGKEYDPKKLIECIGKRYERKYT
jgi:hypothetical protein